VPEWLQAVLDWIEANPHWAGLVVFSVAMAESLVLIGIFIPGAALLLGMGALIALGGLELTPILLWAIAGAIVGDGISFWIGYIYRDRLRQIWPFAKHPQMLARGEAFFLKHGGKSVAMGRFIGPIRAIIPTVAGIMGMSPLRFTIVNVISAIAWAPAYILPGMVIGTSLGLASQVAARLGILLVILAAGVWLVVWGVRAIFNFYQPRAEATVERWLNWGRSHPRLGRLATALLDPARPEAAALTALAMMLIFAAWLFLTLLLMLVDEAALAAIDEATFQVLQTLRTAWADELMVSLSQFGDKQVTLPLTLTVAAWLGLQRRWRAMGHWLGAIGFAVLVTFILSATLNLPRAASIDMAPNEAAAPSGHVAIATVMYGFAAVMLAHALPPAQRWIPSAVAAVVIVAIAVARLYLGTHSLSEVIGAFALGLMWVALLGTGYRRHVLRPVPALSTAGIMLAVFGITGVLHIQLHHQQALASHTPALNIEVLPNEQWWNKDWESIAVLRIDPQGQALQPLNVQWAGRLEDIHAVLRGAGWVDAQAFSFSHALLALAPEPKLTELPILPLSHNGHKDVLMMIKSSAAGAPQRLLRLWPAEAQLDDGTPLWVGSVSDLEVAKLPLVTYLRSTKDFANVLEGMPQAGPELDVRRVTRRPVPANDIARNGHWNGEVVLLRNR